MTRRAGNRCEYCRLRREGQEASFPIDHITPNARRNATELAHLTLACVSLPPAGNWVRSACQIPPWFVVSFALPMTSTRANWLRSGAFVSPRAPWGVERGAWSVISLTHRFTGHCSRATDHCSPATRHHHPLPPAGNWVRFACPIPPWFVLNCDMAMTNTRANWLRFGAFRSPPAPLFGFTDDSSLASRPTPQAPRRRPHAS